MTPAFIAADRVRELATLGEAIEPVSWALQMASQGRATTGLIVMYPLSDHSQGDVFVKTGTMAGAPVHVVKVAPWFARNSDRGQPQGGFVAVLDSATGRTVAFLDDRHFLSDIRTAAAGALAARVLAPAQIKVAGVLGAGVQAYWQTIALGRERSFERLLLWSRNRARAEILMNRLREELPHISIAIIDDVEALVRASDVIITATASREPLVRGEWLRPGQHVTAVGADDPSKCELDAVALQRASVFVDGLAESSENGDIRRAAEQALYSVGDIRGELGAVLSGRISGRTSASEITVAKLVGLGAQDVAVATLIMAKLALMPPTVEA